MADERENDTNDRKKQISGRDRASQTTSSTSQGDPAGNPPPTNGGGVNWGYVGAVGGGAVATGVAAVVAAPVVLGAAGFTAGGVAAGSMAAVAQSAIYGGFTGGAFSVLQSAGAAGIGLAGNAAVGATGATVGGVLSGLGARLYGSRVKTINLLICGGGSDAHAFAGIASSREGIEVRVLSLYQDEAERWSSALQTTSVEVELQRRGHEPMSIKSKPALITKNPDEAMRDIDLVVFVSPASAHEDYLDALKPHIKPGMTVVGLPGGPGFEFQVRRALDETAQPCTILKFASSPWRCRMVEFGVKYEVLITMETLLGTMERGSVEPREDPVCILQNLLGPLPELNVSVI
ncbi:tauropine dehydrogenase-like [Pocillopora verrucosa]|uniref:tauropine dehydrogenase-like n=1 Tax=Pocillopora verrucosa TaxID=203993 RepID=UPI00334077BC